MSQENNDYTRYLEKCNKCANVWDGQAQCYCWKYELNDSLLDRKWNNVERDIVLERTRENDIVLERTRENDTVLDRTRSSNILVSTLERVFIKDKNGQTKEKIVKMYIIND